MEWYEIRRKAFYQLQAMTSRTWWTWVWVNSRRWWWTGRPGMLRFTGSQRVGHDWATELNWTELNWTPMKCKQFSRHRTFPLTPELSFLPLLNQSLHPPTPQRQLLSWFLSLETSFDCCRTLYPESDSGCSLRQASFTHKMCLSYPCVIICLSGLFLSWVIFHYTDRSQLV